MDDLTIYDCMGLASPRWNIKKPDYNTYALLVLKDADQPISNLWPYPPVINKYPSYEPFDFFYCLHNRVHYYRPFCDTVFTVFPLQLQGKYLIRYKNNPHPASLLTDPFIQDKEAYCIQNRHPFTSQVFETKSHLVIFYNYMEMRNCFIFDKDLQQAILNAKGLYFKDQGLLIPPPITDAGNGKDLVRLISSTGLKQLFKGAKKKGKLPEPYRKIYQDLQDSDNPLLIRYSLKE